MLNPLSSLAPLTRSNGEGRLARLEAAVDRLARFCAGLRAGNGIALDFDAQGAPVVSAFGGAAAGTGNYGFRVWVEENTLHVAAGTAQVWGGAVKTYAASNCNVGSGGWIYATCDLSADPPAWGNSLVYDNMANQPASSLWVPIAKVVVSNGDVTVTQCHWGNIVVPALANVVDVQQAAASAE